MITNKLREFCLQHKTFLFVMAIMYVPVIAILHALWFCKFGEFSWKMTAELLLTLGIPAIISCLWYFTGNWDVNKKE